MNNTSKYAVAVQKAEGYGWIIPVALFAIEVVYTLCNDAMDKNYSLKLNFKDGTLDLTPSVVE